MELSIESAVPLACLATNSGIVGTQKNAGPASGGEYLDGCVYTALSMW
jgi:hypothetical protein